MESRRLDTRPSWVHRLRLSRPQAEGRRREQSLEVKGAPRRAATPPDTVKGSFPGRCSPAMSDGPRLDVAAHCARAIDVQLHTVKDRCAGVSRGAKFYRTSNSRAPLSKRGVPKSSWTALPVAKAGVGPRPRGTTASSRSVAPRCSATWRKIWCCARQQPRGPTATRTAGPRRRRYLRARWVLYSRVALV